MQFGTNHKSVNSTTVRYNCNAIFSKASRSKLSEITIYPCGITRDRIRPPGDLAA